MWQSGHEDLPLLLNDKLVILTLRLVVVRLMSMFLLKLLKLWHCIYDLGKNNLETGRNKKHLIPRG